MTRLSSKEWPSWLRCLPGCAVYLAALFTWLPLLILSEMQGLAFRHAVPVSFLSDFSTYTRSCLPFP
jgi:hypothetical protein